MAKTSRTKPHERTTQALGTQTPRSRARLRLPRTEKHSTTMEEDMDHDPRVRKLFDDLAAFRREYGGEDYAGGAAALSEGSGMDQDRMDEMVALRVERNERWGRDASRDTALAELVNEHEIELWEERQPPSRRPKTLADEGEDFEGQVKALTDRGMSRDAAVAELANTGAVAF